MWFKVDDKFHDNRKVLRILQHEHGRSALGLWLLTGSFSGATMSDGFIQSFLLPRYGPDAERDAELLVTFGLFDRGEVDGDQGYFLHDFLDRNPSRAQQLATKAYEKVKNALQRDPALKKAVRSRDKGRCRYCAVEVEFSDHVSETGGSYDHVTPITLGGENNLENVVVACRGCNNAKAGRTPQRWGFALLKPGTTRHGRKPWTAEDA